MSQPTLPTLPSLKLPPEVATIGSMLIGLATLAATTFGVSPDVTNAAVLALQYLIGAIALVVGVAGHLHLHNQHVSLARAALEIAGVQAAASVPLPPSPATTAPASPSYVAPVAPQPAPADTPVQVVPVVADTTPAPAQVATDAT